MHFPITVSVGTAVLSLASTVAAAPRSRAGATYVIKVDGIPTDAVNSSSPQYLGYILNSSSDGAYTNVDTKAAAEKFTIAKNGTIISTGGGAITLEVPQEAPPFADGIYQEAPTGTEGTFVSAQDSNEVVNSASDWATWIACDDQDSQSGLGFGWATAGYTGQNGFGGTQRCYEVLFHAVSA